MVSEDKIVQAEQMQMLRSSWKKEGKKVVLCHGVFDLLHYGHIEHLQEAKSLGDILIVSVTAAHFVNKGPGRPYFNDQQRLYFLASLECVDYVMLSEAVTVHEIVKIVQPDVYVKGQEYATAENDVTGNISSEQRVVEQYGGHIHFTHGEVYSSTKLLNNFFGALPEEVVAVSRRLREIYGSGVAEIIRAMVEGFSKKKVLVVGDIIIDDYVFCKVQGLTTKDAALSTRYDFHEMYAGGALAIARHLAGFAGNVALLSMMGQEEELSSFVSGIMSPVDCHIVKDRNFVTPVKRRYLKRHPLRQEYEKLFSVNHLMDVDAIKRVNYEVFDCRLTQMLPLYDVVVICDYGHGLLMESAIRQIEKLAKFMAVNCQTNSSNQGTNVITKYQRADLFVVDERELRLPFGQSLEESSELLKKLTERLNSRYAWATMGAEGACGLHDGKLSKVPAVTLHVKDTVGAGDAFYAVASLCGASKMPLDISTLICNIAGAIKTNTVGNSKPITKVEVLKFLKTILNV